MEEELRNANYEYYSTSGESSGDEDDDLIQSIVASMGMLCSQFKANERNFKMYNREERVNWQDHVTLLLHRNEFEETYRMEHETFNVLVDTLREDVTFDIAKALSSALNMESIYPELVCGVGLRFLAA
jgi:hypothetical protein